MIPISLWQISSSRTDKPGDFVSIKCQLARFVFLQHFNVSNGSAVIFLTTKEKTLAVSEDLKQKLEVFPSCLLLVPAMMSCLGKRRCR